MATYTYNKALILRNNLDTSANKAYQGYYGTGHSGDPIPDPSKIKSNFSLQQLNTLKGKAIQSINISLTVGGGLDADANRPSNPDGNRTVKIFNGSIVETFSWNRGKKWINCSSTKYTSLYNSIVNAIEAGNSTYTLYMDKTDTDTIFAYTAHDNTEKAYTYNYASFNSGSSTAYAVITYNDAYIITYNANGGSVSPASENINPGSSTTLPTPTRSGYAFKGWYTAASGGTKIGNAGASYTPSASITLYAQWIQQFTVTYVDNGNVGTGTLPPNATVNSGSSYTTAATCNMKWITGTGTYTATFYRNHTSSDTTKHETQTASWTKIRAFGDKYYCLETRENITAGSTITVNQNLTLYVTYVEPEFATTTVDKDFTQPSKNPTAPTGYSFKHWGTSRNASSPVSFPVTPDGNKTYYAVWKLNTYTVSYNANGGSGAPGNDTKIYGQTLTLSSIKPTKSSSSSPPSESTITVSYNANGGTSTPASSSGTRTVTTTTSYTFSSWNTNSNGSGTSYEAGDPYTENAGVTLYAQYSSSTSTSTSNPSIKTAAAISRPNASAGSYTVTFDANGGSCSTSSLSAARTTYYPFGGWKSNKTGDNYSANTYYEFEVNDTLIAQWTSYTSTASITLPTPTRTNYTFKGWSTSKTASSGVTGTYKPTGNVILYAIWGRNVSITQHPQNVTVTVGSTASTSVTAVGDELTYAWYFKDVGSSSWSPSSTKTSTYSITMNTSGRIGRQVYCVITDAYGHTATSNTATLNAQYQIIYNANGGTGTMSNSTHNCRVAKALTANAFTRKGYNFLGWATSSNATTATYADKQSVIGLTYTTSTVTLYAVWEVANFITTVTRYISDSASGAKECEVYYYNGSEWVPIEEMHYYDGTTWVQVGTQIPYVES